VQASGTQPATDLPRQLRLIDGIAIVAGTIIGSGIFIVPNLVARNLNSPPLILGAWIFTGVLSFFGALAYAELGALFPATGGQYVYLREIYGPLWAFLCGWTYFFVILSASIAWLGIVFATYLSYFIPLTPVEAKSIAVALIAVVTAVNYRGVKLGAAVQKLFTAIKLGGLLVLIGSAFLGGAKAAPPPASAPFSLAGTSFSLSHFGIAMIACVLSYDGWVAVTFVAGEIRNPKRNLLLATATGLGIVIFVYVLANAAYLRVLSVPEIARADRVGALVAEKTMGPAGGAFLACVILISIAGSMNGWSMTAPRIFFAQARDRMFLPVFGRIHPRFRTPHVSIALFGAWSALLALTGTYETLASYAMYAAWIFYGLTSAGVIVMRARRPDLARPYRMWGYPASLLLFLAVAAGFVLNTFVATPGPAIASTLLIAAGAPVYWIWGRRERIRPLEEE
jgi:basic amino acid/polyamine antiporter, APA family